MLNNIFIIGPTGIGKTTLARNLASEYQYKLIGASEWVRTKFIGNTEEITKSAIEELVKNPDVCVDFIKKNYPIHLGGFIIEGIRNPRDFAHLFQPNDIIISLSNFGIPIDGETEFEKIGLCSINQMLWFYQSTFGTKFQQFHIGPKVACSSRTQTSDSEFVFNCS